MNDNLIIYDKNKMKYVFDIKKFGKNRSWGDPKVDSSDSLVKLYTLFKAEIILRKYDLKMERHYKNWLINDSTEDVTTDLTNLYKENTQLLIEMRTKFMSADEVAKKKQGFLTKKFFYDLVQTYNIWDLKSRVTVMDFMVDSNQLAAIKKKLDKAFDEAENGTLVYDSTTNRYKFTFRVEAYGKKYYIFKGGIRDRDYYGNYNYGYVGAAFFSYREGDNTLNMLLDYSDLAQRGTNFPKVWEGDTEEDKIAISHGYNDYISIEDSN